MIGVAFDGLGHGTDGHAWGGEFLVADLAGFTRVAHLAEVPMPGGDAATREPWRMALAHLEAAYEGQVPAGLAVEARQQGRWEQVRSVARSRLSPPTSSAGRLFDAVSALLGLRDRVTYEGQAAVDLEHVADVAARGSYPVPITAGAAGGPAVLQVGELVRALTVDLRRGVPVPVLSGRFHNALADVVLGVCRQVRDDTALSTVALSGGCFQNGLLLARCLERLEADRFHVLTSRRVPPNDGGISLGQAAVAATVRR